jgi:hypothetical protein
MLYTVEGKRGARPDRERVFLNLSTDKQGFSRMDNYSTELLLRLWGEGQTRHLWRMLMNESPAFIARLCMDINKSFGKTSLNLFSSWLEETENQAREIG